ncbi:hypothetical protein ABLA30_17680 [Xenorhabdus nematophila]|uniref:hypothetical protein n=1 Tax=Xenorhabdus nematophila TaxID=628 RepID=UPI0032B6FC71
MTVYEQAKQSALRSTSKSDYSGGVVMAKSKRKIQKSYSGMTIPQLVQMKENSIDMYANSKKYIEPYSTNDGNVLIPLNRSMRRHAKKMKIELKEVK